MKLLSSLINTIFDAVNIIIGSLVFSLIYSLYECRYAELPHIPFSAWVTLWAAYVMLGDYHQAWTTSPDPTEQTACRSAHRIVFPISIIVYGCLMYMVRNIDSIGLEEYIFKLIAP